MERTRTKNLVLILARELAANVATPVFVIDPDGTLVFYNEAAESILGTPFAATGELPAGEWGAKWAPEALDGTPIPIDVLPVVRAIATRRPAHGTMRIHASDGVTRTIAVTGLPLLASTDEFVGALAVFWELEETAG